MRHVPQRPHACKLEELELAAGDLCVLCGRYEGIDERVTHVVSDRVSIGPYVLSGGEVAAMAVLDAVIRKVAGVKAVKNEIAVRP